MMMMMIGVQQLPQCSRLSLPGRPLCTSCLC